MAYRIALVAAKGPYVGPWIMSVGTEYAIDCDGYAVVEYQGDVIQHSLELLPQRNPFPVGVRKYRIVLKDHQLDPVSVRVFLH